jgi:WD40 repeat protein
VAVAVGKNIHLYTRKDAEPKILGPHDSSVTDVCFASDGLGLVASHRDGVTLWAWPHYEPQKIHLPWKGAHLGVTLSQDKRWIVTAMQEGALHLWNTALKRDYQMRGYQTKPLSLAWSADRKFLATSGSETVIVWPFDKGGPDGREPLQLGWSNASLVTMVAAHPDENIVAAGFADGALLILDLDNKKSFAASAPSGHAITALQFAPDGEKLVAGAANNSAVLLDFTT